MSAYSLPGYDFWLTSGLDDDGSQDAIDDIAAGLHKDAAEVADASYRIDVPELLLQAALLHDSDDAWKAVRGYYMEQLEKELQNRAVDVFNERMEEARMDAALSRSEAA